MIHFAHWSFFFHVCQFLMIYNRCIIGKILHAGLLKSFTISDLPSRWLVKCDVLTSKDLSVFYQEPSNSIPIVSQWLIANGFNINKLAFTRFFLFGWGGASNNVKVKQVGFISIPSFTRSLISYQTGAQIRKVVNSFQNLRSPFLVKVNRKHSEIFLIY